MSVSDKKGSLAFGHAISTDYMSWSRSRWIDDIKRSDSASDEKNTSIPSGENSRKAKSFASAHQIHRSYPSTDTTIPEKKSNAEKTYNSEKMKKRTSVDSHIHNGSKTTLDAQKSEFSPLQPKISIKEMIAKYEEVSDTHHNKQNYFKIDSGSKSGESMNRFPTLKKNDLSSRKVNAQTNSVSRVRDLSDGPKVTNEAINYFSKSTSASFEKKTFGSDETKTENTQRKKKSAPTREKGPPSSESANGQMFSNNPPMTLDSLESDEIFDNIYERLRKEDSQESIDHSSEACTKEKTTKNNATSRDTSTKKLNTPQGNVRNSRVRDKVTNSESEGDDIDIHLDFEGLTYEASAERLADTGSKKSVNMKKGNDVSQYQRHLSFLKSKETVLKSGNRQGHHRQNDSGDSLVSQYAASSNRMYPSSVSVASSHEDGTSNSNSSIKRRDNIDDDTDDDVEVADDDENVDDGADKTSADTSDFFSWKKSRSLSADMTRKNTSSLEQHPYISLGSTVKSDIDGAEEMLNRMRRESRSRWSFIQANSKDFG